MIFKKFTVTLVAIFLCLSINGQSGLVSVYSFSELKETALDPVNDDKIYVINFWATWCGPCVKELPHFFKLQEDYPEIEFIYVSLDFPDQVDTKLLPFIKEHNMAEKTILFTHPDEKGWISKVHREWGGAIPITIIKKNDKRHYLLSSVESYEVLETEIKNFL